MTITYFRNKVSGKVIESDEHWVKVYRTQPDLEELKDYSPTDETPATPETPTPIDTDDEDTEDTEDLSDSPAPTARKSNKRK